MSRLTSVRAARLSDVPAIARVHVETWRATYPGIVPEDYLVNMTEARQAELWQASIRRARGADTVLVADAMDGSGVVGFGNCGRSRRGGAMGEVFTLYVASDWQGKAIGHGLLTGLFASLHEHGLNQAMVWVLSANPARFFYEAMGGKRLAERREPFSGMVLDESAYGWSDLGAWLTEHHHGGGRQ
ncbi:MAG TPA: GNAT family N-acetyltransferase [Kiloniellales bacterium]